MSNYNLNMSPKKGGFSIIVTIPPYSSYLDRTVGCELVKGVRFNSAQPMKKSHVDVIGSMCFHTCPKELWVDLKGRELRIKNSPTVPKDKIKLSHKIEVDTPTEMYFNDGEAWLPVNEANGRKITPDVPDGMEMKFGKGASINIPDESLKIKGYLTREDKKYVKAAKRVGVHNYMLSYVEKESDILEVLKLDEDARIVAKIESKKGMEFVRNVYPKYKDRITLMAARGDLYIELDMPHEIMTALEEIIEADPDAIVASRILNSLENPNSIPRCSDICEIGYLKKIGYKNFMLGDGICLKEESTMAAIGLLEAILGGEEK